MCIKTLSFNVWVRYFVWNFKGDLWNSTQNILPIHWNMYISWIDKIVRAPLTFFETVPWTSIWEQPPLCHSKIAWFHLNIDRITISTSSWITYEPITEHMTRRVTYWDENHGYTMQIWLTVSNLLIFFFSFPFFLFFLFLQMLWLSHNICKKRKNKKKGKLTCKVLHHFVWTQRPFWIICTVQSLSEIMAD